MITVISNDTNYLQRWEKNGRKFIRALAEKYPEMAHGFKNNPKGHDPAEEAMDTIEASFELISGFLFNEQKDKAVLELSKLIVAAIVMQEEMLDGMFDEALGVDHE